MGRWIAVEMMLERPEASPANAPLKEFPGLVRIEGPTNRFDPVKTWLPSTKGIFAGSCEAGSALVRLAAATAYGAAVRGCRGVSTVKSLVPLRTEISSQRGFPLKTVEPKSSDTANTPLATVTLVLVSVLPICVPFVTASYRANAMSYSPEPPRGPSSSRPWY